MTHAQTRLTQVRVNATVGAWIVATFLLILALSGLVARYVPGAGSLVQVGVVGLIVVGIVSLPRLRLTAGVAVTGALFLVLCTVAAAQSASLGIEYAFRGWVGLVAAIFAGSAVAGTISGAPSTESKSANARVILRALAVAVVANVILGFRQALFGMDSAEIAQARAGVSTFEAGDWIRLMGTFATNQDFGLLMGCVAPAVFIFALGHRGRARVWLLALSIGIYGVVILSLTRTSLIASVVAAVFGLLFLTSGGATQRTVRAVVVGGVVICASVVILSQAADPRIKDSVARATTLFNLADDVSFNARQNQTLPRALHALQEAPFGSGAGSAGPVSQSFPFSAPFGSLTTDNGYLMVAIQIGYIGAATLVFMLLLLVLHLARSESLYSRAAAASVIALLVAMASAQYWSLLASISIVAALVGVGIAHADPPGARRRR